MAQFPALPLWTDAYLGDTTHLTTLEHGAYFLLLMAMWRTKECSLPNDDKMLARYTRLTPSQWKRIKHIILEFFDIKDGQIIQQRLRDEINLVKQKSKSASKNSRARWLKSNESNDAPASDPQCNGNATTTTTTPIDDKKDTNVSSSSSQMSDDERWILEDGFRYCLSMSKRSSEEIKTIFQGWLEFNPAQTVREAIQIAQASARSDPVNYTTQVLHNRKSQTGMGSGSGQKQRFTFEDQIKTSMAWAEEQDRINEENGL